MKTQKTIIERDKIVLDAEEQIFSDGEYKLMEWAEAENLKAHFMMLAKRKAKIISKDNALVGVRIPQKVFNRFQKLMEAAELEYSM